MKYILCLMGMALSVVGITLHPMALASEAALKTLQNNQPTLNASITIAQQININTASLTQLMSIKGIGKVKARAIIDYREKNGTYTSLQELTKVKGFSPKLVEKIKGSLVLS